MKKLIFESTFDRHKKLLFEKLNIQENEEGINNVLQKCKELLLSNPFLKDEADKITEKNLVKISDNLVFLHLDDTFKHAKFSHTISSELPGSKFDSKYLTDDILIKLIQRIAQNKPTQDVVERNVGKLKWFNVDMGEPIGFDSVIKKSELPSGMSSENYEFKEKIGNIKAIPAILKNSDVKMVDSNKNQITLDNVDSIDMSGTTSYFLLQPLQVVNLPLRETNKVNLILAVIGNITETVRLVTLMTIFPGEAAPDLMNKQDYIKAGYVFCKGK